MSSIFVNTEKKEIRILLVEDDDGDAKAVTRAFSKSKIENEIIRASDGIEALEILRHQNVDKDIDKPYILLVDINMPRMDGLSFIREVRSDENLKRALVFVLTTSKSESDRGAAYDLNVAGYIVKQNAGHDFLSLIDLMDCYWRIIALPV